MAPARPRPRAYRRLIRSGVVTARAALDTQRSAASQAALRRIAAVAAAGSPPQTVFGTVTAEASALLDGALVALARFEADADEAVVLAQTGGHVALGGRGPGGGGNRIRPPPRAGPPP